MYGIADRIFSLADREDFNRTAPEVFRVQAENNPVYGSFLRHLGIEPRSVSAVDQIPFLPIGFFKSHRVVTGGGTPELVFESSGTTGMHTSRHYVKDPGLYERSFLTTFRNQYGNPEEYCILALLPSYLERQRSSLVYMTHRLIEKSGHPDSGFYLDNLEALATMMKKRITDRHPTLLLGVSFALLDLAEHYPMHLPPEFILMETGGMKGRRKELTKEELHETLCRSFGKTVIHSEYGMTELLSQAYSHGRNRFTPPPWMRIMIRDPHDPLAPAGPGRTGGINVIDLANLHSCAFIATADLGRVYEDGSFEVMGRFDHADIRGCNLLAT
mgnify:FL=1